MRIVYRGGYNKEFAQKSMWNDYLEPVIKWINEGKNVALVTLAKPDNYFAEFIKVWPKGIKVINYQTRNVNWDSFDVVIIPGGDRVNLFNGLKSAGFSLTKFKSDTLLMGDSAGAYVLSTYFSYSPRGDDRGKIIEYFKGFNSQNKIITIGHSNNPRYCNPLLIEKVTQFAKEKGLKVLILEENQEKLLNETGKLVDFERNKLFNP